MTLYLTLYIDGSCKNNGKPHAKGGIGIYIDTNLHIINNIEISRNLAELLNTTPTNQKAELMAMHIALNIILRIIQPNDNIIYTIYTDSKYVYNSVTLWIFYWKNNNWLTRKKRKIKNEEIMKDISKLLDKLNSYNIEYKHIRSHQSKPDLNCDKFKHWYGNHMADKLAENGALSIIVKV